MEKPVIILGDGVWGGLLAMRLNKAMPHLPLKLYIESSSLENLEPLSFRESECKDGMSWLRPLVSHSWKQQHIIGPQISRCIKDSYHYIDSKKFNSHIEQNLGPSRLCLNHLMTPEFASQEGSFVIDARNECYFSKSGFKKCLIIEVEFVEEHQLSAPIIFDNNIETKNFTRHISYYPLDKKSLLIKDLRYSDHGQINLTEMRSALSETIKTKGWKIAKVNREDVVVSKVPLTPPFIKEEGKVVNLCGLFHDTTGSSLSMATALIEQMIKTSFRYGELKEVVRKFRKQTEMNRDFLRFINRLLIEKRELHIFEVLYAQPYPLIERFFCGNLKALDRYRMKAGILRGQLKNRRIPSFFKVNNFPRNSST
jgi:lycopene beta-cyclase